MPTPIAVLSSSNDDSWRVRDAAENLLIQRGLRSTSIPDGKIVSPRDQDDEEELPEPTQIFDIDDSLARIKRDKAAIVKLAFDAGASAILENLHKADDDDDEGGESAKKYDRLPALLDDVVKLEKLRVASLERAHANKDLAKRKIAVAKEQAEQQRLQPKAKPKESATEKNTLTTIVSVKSKATDSLAEKESSNNALDGKGTTKSIKVEQDSTTVANGGDDSLPISPIKKEDNTAGSKVTVNNTEEGTTKSTTTTTPQKPSSSPAPAKFTRNTPASSSAALEARLTGSRAILCTTANICFDKLTPGLGDDRVVEVSEIPQNPNKKTTSQTTPLEAKTETEAATAPVVVSDVETSSTSTVPNMGPVIIEAQKLGKRIENVATNAARRSSRRFRMRRDNVRFRSQPYKSNLQGNKKNGSDKTKPVSGFRILENPFAWKDDENENDKETPMEVDETVSVVTAENIPMETDDIKHDPNENETWDKLCIPRLLSVFQTGVGNAILHDVKWSSRYRRIANLLGEFSKIPGDTTAKDSDRNFGPHLIVTVGPDVDRFAKEFKPPNSHLRLNSTVEENSLRALAYKGSKAERRKLREQFQQGATGLPESSFHVIVTSYADFLSDYLHFCQFPFEMVLLDDGASWMAAAYGDPNSDIATVWEDALFSKNDQQMGLAGTSMCDNWDFSRDTPPNDAIKEAWIGLTARHRLVTSSKLKIDNPKLSDEDSCCLPISGLMSLVLPQFASAVKEEWDRSRIGNDASSMSHFRELLTRVLVVHDPSSTDDLQRIGDSSSSSIHYQLAMKTLKGTIREASRDYADTHPTVPKEISDDRFIADGKVANSRRLALQWLGPKGTSWLRYELGTTPFEPILAAMKTSTNYGHICEEITTTLAHSSAGTVQIMGSLAFRLALRSGKSFISEQGLRQHISTHHAPPGTWLCRICKVDCVTSQARTHHERTCGQPSAKVGTKKTATAAAGASNKGGSKKRGGRPSKATSAPSSEEKDIDGSVRVPTYRGVWVDQAGKYFIKIRSERVFEQDKKTPRFFESSENAAKKYDEVLRKSKDIEGQKKEYNYDANGNRIAYEDASKSSSSTTTSLGGGVVPALSVINIDDLPPDVKPLLRDPRQTSRTGGNSKRHVYAYRGVCRQARKGHDRWQSQISFLGVNHYLGTFDSEWDAAAIYAWAHLILYGEEATRQAQKEGEEAAAAYEQEQKDIAAGIIPATPAKPEKKSKPGSNKKPKDKAKGKKDGKAEEKRKPGRPKKKADESVKQPPKKRARNASETVDLASILAKSVTKAPILVAAAKFADMSDEKLMEEAAARMVAARSVNYCVTEVSQPAPIHADFRPCIPRNEDMQHPMGGVALLFGIDPSMFGWTIDSILSQQYFGSDDERMIARSALEEEFGQGGLNQRFQSLVQGSTTVIGCASSRMKRVYASLGMGFPPIGGPIGPIDCNTGGNSKCCVETAACIRFAPTDTGDFQLTALSSDLITMNGQRITPEMGSFPLFNGDICTIGSRVFIFLLGYDAD